MSQVFDEFTEKLLKAYQRSTVYPDEHECPRGVEQGRTARAVWCVDNTCSYCGSLHPDILMARIEVGTVTLDPTDKSYKLYVHNEGGEAFKQSFRGEDCPGGGDPTKWVWTTRDQEQCKFYFQHFSPEQRKRFIVLLNEKKLKLNHPGYFYQLPFFVTR